MATNKLLQSLSEDPQLEKQIGCMAGILQLFDRHQVLTGRRLYGHKRISFTGKTQTSASNCGSETNGSSNETTHHEDEKSKHNHSGAASRSSSPEPLKNQLVSTPSPTDKGTLRVSQLVDTSSRELPKVSFDIRSSVVAPRRLDSSRSLHEARVNISHEGKVCPRRSVDTAERAAAAARGALKELSRISTESTADEVNPISIRDVVRASFGQEQPVSKSTSSSVTSCGTITRPAPRVPASEGAMCKHGLPMETSKVSVDGKSCPECTPASKQMQAASYVPQASARAGREVISRPVLHYKPKLETPTRTSADLSESLRLLAKLREAPGYNSTGGNANVAGNRAQAANHEQPARSSIDLSKEGPLPRFSFSRSSDQVPSRMSSYEPARASSVDLFLQGGPNSRETPRLSLDGRGARFKTDREAAGGKLLPRSLMTSRSVSCSTSDCDTESVHEKRTSFSSNVVAKLMGLEEMPSISQASKAQPKLDLSSSSGNRVMSPSESSNGMNDSNPTFSQCGKYVSASFFPSKRRDDVKIAMNPEEEEEEDYLQLEPLSQEARTLNTRAGQLKLQAGDRLVTTEYASHLGNSFYQPKNHHLMEDRPHHVLSPATRICAEIQEMQRTDSLYKEVDRGLQNSRQDLEALKQLLGAIHLKEHSHQHGSRLDKLELKPGRGMFRKQQPETGRLFLYEQQPQQAAEQQLVISPEWKPKRMLNEEQEAQTHDYGSSRRVPLETHNRRVKSVHSAALPSSRHSSPDCNQSPRSREARSSSSASSSPRKANVSNGRNAGSGITNVGSVAGVRRVAGKHTGGFMSAGLPASSQTPFNQQQRQSSSNGSEGPTSVCSTSTGNSRYRGKQNNLYEKGAGKRKAASNILKDKEECKANLVSLKPQIADKKSSDSGLVITRNSSARTAPRLQNPKTRSMRSLTTSVRKAEDVKRKLNFLNGPSTGDQMAQGEAHFVDKSIVTSSSSESIKDELLHDTSSPPDINEVSSSGTAHHEVAFPPTPPPFSVMQSEPGSPQLLVSADGTRHIGQFNHQGLSKTPLRREEQIMTHSAWMQKADASPTTCQAGALKLPEQENEDTESQGDKSTGSCEQPSPISVLVGPFYKEGISMSTKFALKFEDLDAVGSTDVKINEFASVERSPQGQCRLIPDPDVCESVPADNADFEYVKQLLKMAGSPPDGQSGFSKLSPLEPQLFFLLEAAKEETRSGEVTDGIMWNRRLLFEAVNSSLKSRLRQWLLFQQQPWILANKHNGLIGCASSTLKPFILGFDEENNVCLSSEGGRLLLSEVWKDIESARKKHYNSFATASEMREQEEEEAEEGACDGVGRLLEEDMLDPRRSLDWSELDVEKGEISLDLERLIFKDLIDQTIRDLGVLGNPHSTVGAAFSTTSKRQLFQLH